MARDAWLAEQVDEHAGGPYDPRLYRHHGLASTVDLPLPALGPQEHARYQADGYLAMAGAFDRAAVADAIAGVDRLIGGQVGFRGIQWEAAIRERLPRMTLPQRRAAVRKLIYFVDHEPRLLAMARDEQLLRVVRDLLGEEPELFADQALLKPPGIGREKPWHQDKAFFDVRPGTPVVGVWIALDEADTGNGCMHIIPGSHAAGPVTHFTRRDFQICDSDVQTPGIVAVPLRPGGCLFFDGLLHHGTPANTSPKRRWALQFHYAPASAIWRSSAERAVYKRRRLEAFGADGKDVTC